MTKKILSLLLVLCFIVGLLPTMASAAENTTLELKPAITNDPDKWAEFVESFSSAKLGDMVSIEVTGSVELPAPLVNAETGGRCYCPLPLQTEGTVGLAV